MLIAAWLAMFAIGWFSNRWRSGLPIALVVAVGTTALCLVTTNSPVFTAVERHLSFTAESIALNFLAKLTYTFLFYSAGHLCKRAVDGWRRKAADTGIPDARMQRNAP